MTRPAGSRSGILVVETQETVPSGHVSISSMPTSGRPVFITCSSLARASLRVFADEEVGVRFSDGQRRIVQAEAPGVGPADPQKPAVGILEIDGVRHLAHQDFKEVLVAARRILRAVSLNRLPDHADEKELVRFGDEEIVLRPQLQRSERQFFVLRPGQHDQRHTGRDDAGFAENIQG
jgi:hypothetical protein